MKCCYLESLIFPSEKDNRMHKTFYCTNSKSENNKRFSYDKKFVCKNCLDHCSTEWHNVSDKPNQDVYVIVMDKDGKTYNNHLWNGMCWYQYVIGHDGDDGWRSDVENITHWRYQYKK